MIASDQAHRVRDLLGDWGLDTFQWTNEQIYTALSWAQHTIGEELLILQADVSLTTMADGVCFIPFETMEVFRVSGPMGILLKTTQALEDMKNPNWRTLVGTPSGWMMESGGAIRLNRNWSGTITVGIIDHPLDLVDDADLIDVRIPENLQDTLKFGAAAHLLAEAGSTQDLARAEAFLVQFYRELGVPYKPQGRKTE